MTCTARQLQGVHVMLGARDDQPGLADLLAYIREGDSVVVWTLDQPGCNMLHILQTVRMLPWRRHPGISQ